MDVGVRTALLVGGGVWGRGGWMRRRERGWASGSFGLSGLWGRLREGRLVELEEEEERLFMLEEFISF